MASPVATRTTYRYLRISMVAMVALLALSILVELRTADGRVLESVSAYYYTPVRAVFVGALVAIGLSLVSIQGRRGAEDIMLNLAGMLSAVVAFVPAPLTSTERVSGVDVPRMRVPDEAVPGVENNVTALLLLGAAALAFACWAAWSDGRPAARDLAGLVASGALWAALSLWFWLGPGSFLQGAHYAAAIGLFGLIAAVAVTSSRRVRLREETPGLAPSQYGYGYAMVAAAMVATVLAAAVLAVLDQAGAPVVGAWVFVVETVLLTLFTAFWLLQTAENWRDGVPQDT
ncbi:MAG: hypothetical protein WB441_05595 [Nocardioidaceae bacterium]